MQGERDDGRQVLRIGGADRRKFLQDLVTNDLAGIDSGLVYAALLTPQGKYLADFFLFERDGAIWLDAAASLAPALAQRLSMYRLRADVTIEPAGMRVSRGLGDPPDGAFPDPRHPALGWRAYGTEAGEPRIDWAEIRVRHAVPESGIELLPNDTYPLEAGLDRLRGVDFRKGCYVGQEVTARMKHKTELRKGLVRVEIEGAAPPGTPITADGKAVGTLFTSAGGQALAWLRFDRASGPMTAGDATITWQG